MFFNDTAYILRKHPQASARANERQINPDLSVKNTWARRVQTKNVNMGKNEVPSHLFQRRCEMGDDIGDQPEFLQLESKSNRHRIPSSKEFDAAPAGVQLTFTVLCEGGDTVILREPVSSLDTLVCKIAYGLVTCQS